MPEQHNIEWKTVCRSQRYPAPHFEVLGDNLTVAFYADVFGKNVQVSGAGVQASGNSVQINKQERILQEILSYCMDPLSLAEIVEKFGVPCPCSE